MKTVFQTGMLTVLIAATLSACSTHSVEQEILQSAAVEDARSAPKALHRAYLECYPLSRSQKRSCRDRVSHTHTRHYILTFDHEAERQGFAAFLRDHGKPCDGVHHGPLYHEDQNVYVVNCTGGDRYRMRFDRASNLWRVL